MSKMAMMTRRLLERWRRTALAAALLAGGVLSANSAMSADAPLTLGVFPRFNASESTTRYSGIAEHLGQYLGRTVILVTPRDFPSFWKGVEERQYDIVQYNQYHYIRSAAAYQVVAHNKEFGRSMIAGAIYVRKDSGITSLTQLRGRTVLFGGSEDAMIGHIAVAYTILKAGVKRAEFKSQFAPNPLNSVIGVYHKQVDAGGSGDGVLEQPVMKKSVNPDELTVLAVSDPLLHLPWAVKRTIPPKVRESIQAALVSMEKSEAGQKILKAAYLSGIGPAEDKDYEPHRRMVKAVMGPQ